MTPSKISAWAVCARTELINRPLSAPFIAPALTASGGAFVNPRTVVRTMGGMAKRLQIHQRRGRQQESEAVLTTAERAWRAQAKGSMKARASGRGERAGRAGDAAARRIEGRPI